MRPPWGLSVLLALALNATPALSSAVPQPDVRESTSQPPSQTRIEGSHWYDWGWYGVYPRVSYESFGARSPWPNLLRTDDRCSDDDGLLFIQPRGAYVDTPGPIVLDNAGNLVWMETRWGQAMDVKVQRYRGADYITFWHGTDNGTFGEGHYFMIDDTYQVAKEVVPVGAGLSGDLHEFRITEHGTALMTVYSKVAADLSGYGISSGWIFDSIFQEMDIETGELLLEWRASDHFAVHESLADRFGLGASPDTAFDFFHINSIDTDLDGDYLISSRYFCSVLCISRTNGAVLWQLGGALNDFVDLSDGAATNFTWNHHASWYDKERRILTVFDNGSWGKETSADLSRGLMVQLNLDLMTASLVQAYVAPQELLTPSQGSIQVLPSDNVLVGWGHTPAWTEFTMEGEALCDTHIAPFWLAKFGWVKNYRTFKAPWVGRPAQPPDVAMRPGRGFLFASWNGATEVRRWRLQSASGTDESISFRDIGDAVSKTTFETRLAVPAEADDFVRAVALDAQGNVLGRSKSVYKYEKTVTPLLEAPSRSTPPEPAVIFTMSLFATSGLAFIVYIFRSSIKRRISGALRTGVSTYNYHRLPMKG